MWDYPGTTILVNPRFTSVGRGNIRCFGHHRRVRFYELASRWREGGGGFRVRGCEPGLGLVESPGGFCFCFFFLVLFLHAAACSSLHSLYPPMRRLSPVSNDERALRGGVASLKPVCGYSRVCMYGGVALLQQRYWGRNNPVTSLQVSPLTDWAEYM